MNERVHWLVWLALDGGNLDDRKARLAEIEQKLGLAGVAVRQIRVRGRNPVFRRCQRL
jgi:hypothetical protein